MIRIISFEQVKEWDSVVRSFPNYDVYYLSGYAKAFSLHGDGNPILIYYEGPTLRGIYVAMRRDVARAKPFIGKINEGCCYDLVSPYGYGGFVLDGEVNDDTLGVLYEEFVSCMKEMNVICNFTRYSPVLKNAIPMKKIFNVIDLGKTVAMDLASEELIWNNIIGKCHNKINKAVRNGLTVHHSNADFNLFKTFMDIYRETMDHDDATDYYYFPEEFYRSIHEDLHDEYELFYVEFDGRIIAMAIMLFANGMMHYHLSGSLVEYRNMAPTNLLLYEAAKWGCRKGLKLLHLGGGLGSGEDSLYVFKMSFNKNSDFQFSISKDVFDKEKYDDLIRIRKESDESFNSESSFFPLYRA
jgi:hypothetical protein